MPDPSPRVGRPGTTQQGHSPTWPALSNLIRLPNQSGTMLLMLPTLWALVLASHGQPPITLLIIFAVGSFFMRSAGVVLNDLADRSFDRQVDRTRMRPLASGALGVPEALATATALVLMAASLLVFLNQLTILLSPVALLLAAIYPFTKRIIQLPQAVLGIAFGWGVVMAWAAVRGSLDDQVWLLYASTVFWAVAYDTIYALQDRADDARIGVKSSAILFGTRAWIAVGASVCGMLLLLAATGWLVGIGPAFYGMLAAVGGFLTHQVWKLREPVSPNMAFALFKQHVWVGWAILAGIWLGFVKF
ncbi:MAG: 4-hydroxybenzoate octaprenyltransferase [Nitrospirae bacterium]|nr:MAG: 4-hydroxybenzoate octaprenyltransferase [Nitrospirota bacterium]